MLLKLIKLLENKIKIKKKKILYYLKLIIIFIILEILIDCNC